MTPAQLVLHCYAEKKDGEWQAFCLDLTLATQGASFADAREKLYHQIAEYVFDALAGEDRDFADQLLYRRAPLGYWLKYYFYGALATIGRYSKDLPRLFSLPMPLEPIHHNHA